ncbi:UDP-glucose 4-epimerase GalE [Streptomyces sp. NPDC050759]|uniref:UDP-glucose 4-epimerase GalE n=1 Tax=Streptomyces sp. NPDC050759 TaxID=3365635 RepID=UPI003787DBB1
MARSESVPSTVLVTGGAGFLGSHACVEFLDHGYEIVVVDDYSRSAPQVLTRVERIAGRFVGAVYELDIRDRRALSAVFDRHCVDAVVHFAAHHAVGESARTSLPYYDTNLGGTIALLHTMREHDVRRLVYASTCAVYGDAGPRPLDETTPPHPVGPYARSKWICEQILTDVCRYRDDFTVLCLRHATPAGAHPSGLLGEDPHGTPDSPLQVLAQVAEGRLDRLRVFGADHPTPDGTAIRDYLHVMDAAEAHRVALDHLTGTSGMRVYNLGSGKGSSVLETIAVFSRTCGRPLPYDIRPRRPDDIPELVADASAVARDWGWRATRTLSDMCRDAWHFGQLNPHGYADSARRPDAHD